MKIALISIALLTACSSTSGGMKNLKPTVELLEASDSKPTWVSLTTPTGKEEGGRFFVSFVTVGGEASKAATLNMSDEKAFSEAFRSIVNEFLDQTQMGEDDKATIGHRIISSTRNYRPAMPSLHISSRYWENVVITLPDGSFRSELRAFSKASVSENDYQRASKTYLDSLNKAPEMKALLQEIAHKQLGK